MPTGLGLRPLSLTSGLLVEPVPLVMQLHFPAVTVSGGVLPSVQPTPLVFTLTLPAVTCVRGHATKVELIDGSTVRATWFQGSTATFANYDLALTSAQLDAIANWGDLRARLTATGETGRTSVAFMELAVPASGGGLAVTVTPLVLPLLFPAVTASVGGTPPSAVIGSPTSPTFTALVGQTVTFDPAGTSDDGQWGGTWNFGDGTSHTGTFNDYPSHVVNKSYGAAGTYVVTWTARDAEGNTDIATTTGTISAQASVPTTLVVDPPSFVIPVGGQQQLTAQVLDQFGNPMTGQVVGWASDNTSRATVSPSTGAQTTVTGQSSTGTVTITGATPPGGAIIDTSAGTITTAGLYPNEPSGFTRLAEHSFDHLPDATGTGTEFVVAGGNWSLFNASGSNAMTIIDWAGALQTPPKALQYVWRQGLNGGQAGSAAGGLWSTRWPECSELYVSYKYKLGGPNNDYENHVVATKYLGYVTYGKTDRSNQFFLRLSGGGGAITAGPFFLTADFTSEYSSVGSQQDFGQSGSGTTGAAQVRPTRGEHCEMYFKLNTNGSQNGLFKCWINGVMTHNLTTVEYINSAVGATTGLRGFQFDPVWGGTGGTKTRADYLWLDHVYASGVFR